jgi:hypothetical protein
MARPGLILALLLIFLPLSGHADPRADVMAVARSLIGTTERTGRNDGPVIEAILASTGNRRGDPYCASFIYYCGMKAGHPRLYPRSAWSPDMVRNPTWTRAHGGREPQAGDAAGIYFPAKGRIAHALFIEESRPSVFVTIEANTSPEARAGSAADRDGGGIHRKRRLRAQVHSVRDWITPR